jgi:hypothetical protein
LATKFLGRLIKPNSHAFLAHLAEGAFIALTVLVVLQAERHSSVVVRSLSHAHVVAGMMGWAAHALASTWGAAVASF